MGFFDFIRNKIFTSRQTIIPSNKQAIGNLDIRGSLCTLTSQQLIEKYFTNQENTFVVDSQYGVATKGWFEEEMFKFFEDEMKRRDIWKYSESNDCDNFAWEFRNCCNWANALDGEIPSIAVGTIYYKQDYGSGHAINIAIVQENGSLVKKYIEPQSPDFVTLTESEEKSIIFVHF